MKIAMIAAMDRNRAIGKNGGIPWHIPKDFQWFKQNTLKHPVLMGRKCYEDIISYTKGKPLPCRTNVILTNQKQQFPDGFNTVHSIEQFINQYKENEKVFIIGGEKIYQLFAEITDELYLTTIDTVIENPTAFFPQNFLEKKKPCFLKQENDEKFSFKFQIFKKD